MTLSFGTDAEEGADISIYWKIAIYVGYMAVQCASIILNYYKPFLSLYWSILLYLGIPLSFIVNVQLTTTTIVKQILVGAVCILMNLWRISRGSDNAFTKQSGVNYFIYRQLKDRFNQKFMEWYFAIFIFLNILWAVTVDSMAGSYINASSGLILALTVPLPSSIGSQTPGYQIQPKGKEMHWVIPDMHWSWTTLYTSWDFVFAWMWTLNIWGTAYHLIPPFLFCVVTRQWAMYMEARAISLHLAACIWRLIEYPLGEPVQIESELAVYIWSGINLSAVLCWTLYYLCRIWRRRIWSKCDGDGVNLDELSNGTSDVEEEPMLAQSEML